MKQAAGILSVIIMVGAAFFVLFGKQPTKEQQPEKGSTSTRTTEKASVHSETTVTTTSSTKSSITTAVSSNEN